LACILSVVVGSGGGLDRDLVRDLYLFLRELASLTLEEERLGLVMLGSGAVLDDPMS
jgi:deoxyhypusine synthase